MQTENDRLLGLLDDDLKLLADLCEGKTVVSAKEVSQRARLMRTVVARLQREDA